VTETTVENNVTAEQLAALEPLSSLTAARLQELSQLCVFQRLPTGSTLFREGDTDNEAFYLLKGQVRLANNAADKDFSLVGGSEDARHPIADRQPRQMTAVAVSGVEVIRFDNDLLEMMMTWDDLAELEFLDEAADSSFTANKNARAFQRLPAANFDKVRDRMEVIDVKAGDVVMTEGDAGDFYYLIDKGTAKVSRQGAGGPMVLAELGPGDSMGEEALVSDNPRNATVTMVTDGRLLRLGKRDFDELMREPMVGWIELATAKPLVASGKAKWLDVRTISEFRHARVTDAVFCPLRDIRRQVDRLDKATQYVCYCKTGKRSSAAAYLLNERGYKAHALRGGLQALPEDN